MITIELQGGLGNQLFQIATLISYSLDTKNVYVLNKKTMLYGPIRNYELYWDSIFQHIRPYCKENLNETVFKNIFKEQGFTYDSIPYLSLIHI